MNWIEWRNYLFIKSRVIHVKKIVGLMEPLLWISNDVKYPNPTFYLTPDGTMQFEHIVNFLSRIHKEYYECKIKGRTTETRIKILVSTWPISFRPIYRFARFFEQIGSGIRIFVLAFARCPSNERKKEENPGEFNFLDSVNQKFLMISFDLLISIILLSKEKPKKNYEIR